MAPRRPSNPRWAAEYRCCMMAQFTVGDYTRYTFGDRWKLGIECEVLNRPGEPFGSLWYWIAGQIAGNPDEEEQLAIAWSDVSWMLNNGGRRPDKLFSGLTDIERLSLVDWAIFGEDDGPEAARWSAYGRAGFEPYRLIRKNGGPSFDGWEGLLSEEDNSEHVVWRRTASSDVKERTFPRGTFKTVASEFCMWFEDCRRQRLCENTRLPVTDV